MSDDEGRKQAEREIFGDDSDSDREALTLDDDEKSEEERGRKRPKQVSSDEDEDEEEKGRLKKFKKRARSTREEESSEDDLKGDESGNEGEAGNDDFDELFQASDDEGADSGTQDRHDSEEPEQVEAWELEYYEDPRPPRDSHHYLLKLPNFLGIEPRPFDSETHLFEDDVEETDEEGRKVIKPTLETTIRWRYVRDENGNIITDEKGVPQMESNARFVRWSDGSTHLILGGNEFLNAEALPIQGKIDKRKPASSNSSSTSNEQQGTISMNHLFTSGGDINPCVAQLKEKMVFTPATLKSKVHRKLALSIIEKHKDDGRKILFHLANVDPEKEKEQKEKDEAERNKTQGITKRLSYQRRTEERLSKGYLEDDNRFSNSEGRGRRVSSDDRDSDQRLLSAKQMAMSRFSRGSSGATPSNRGAPGPRKPARRDDYEDEDEYEDDDEEEEEIQDEEEEEEDEDELSSDEGDRDRDDDDDVQLFDE